MKEDGKKNGWLVPMADGKNFKRREDVTDEDIAALAKADYFHIAERVTDADLAVLEALADEARRDGETWKRRLEALQDEQKEGERFKTRMWKAVIGIDVAEAAETLDTLRLKTECLVGTHDDARTLKRIQGESKDIIDLYRRFVAEADFSGWQGGAGEPGK